jgi:hypothetical protein
MTEITPLAGRLHVSIGPQESSLLRELLKEMQTLLEADIPDIDPVKQRLFPDAYEDEKDEQGYRELIGSELQDAKTAALSDVQRGAGDDGMIETWVPPGEIGSWLSVLTDLRLAIGVRLDVTEESMLEEVEPSHPDASAYAVLHWLGWLQESFLDAIRKGGIHG